MTQLIKAMGALLDHPLGLNDLMGFELTDCNAEDWPPNGTPEERLHALEVGWSKPKGGTTLNWKKERIVQDSLSLTSRNTKKKILKWQKLVKEELMEKQEREEVQTVLTQRSITNFTTLPSSKAEASPSPSLSSSTTLGAAEAAAEEEPVKGLDDDENDDEEFEEDEVKLEVLATNKNGSTGKGVEGKTLTERLLAKYADQRKRKVKMKRGDLVRKFLEVVQAYLKSKY